MSTSGRPKRCSSVYSIIFTESARLSYENVSPATHMEPLTICTRRPGPSAQ